MGERVFPAVLVCFCIICHLAAETVWQGETLRAWSVEKADSSFENGVLKLTNIKADMHLISPLLDIVPDAEDVVSYRVRAVGSGKSSGQLFFAREGESFSETRVVTLAAPVPDGKWHTISVPVAKLKNGIAWAQGGKITNLRLDPTDSAGGTIEISEIRISKSAGGKMPKETSSSLTSWKGDTLAQWSVNKADSSLENGVLVITNIKSDVQIISPALAVDPEQYNRLTYRVRATGTGTYAGQLFFKHAGEEFSAARMINIPAPRPDGQWHTVVIDASSLADPSLWSKGGKITGLRLDPTDSSGGKFEISEIVLSKSNAKALAKFTPRLEEGTWDAVTPSFPKMAPASKGAGACFTGKMIRNPRDVPSQNILKKFYMRREVVLKSAPQQAWIQFTADDSAEIYLNGKEVAQTKNWKVLIVADVTSALKAGPNVWAVCHHNSGSAGGIAAELFVRYGDGTFSRFNTDENFRTTAAACPDWLQPNCDLSRWETVVLQEPPPYPPWTVAMPYRDFSNIQKFCGASVSADTKAGKEVVFTYRFEGKMPQSLRDFSLTIGEGEKVFWEEEIPESKQQFRKTGENRWELSFTVQLPLYLPSHGGAEFRLGGSLVNTCLGGTPQLIADFKGYKTVPGYENAVSAKVVRGPYGPYVQLNGKPFYPMIASGGEKNLLAGGKRFRISEGLINIVTVSSPRGSASWWTGDGEYDFSIYDQRAESFRRVNPDCWFVIDLSAYPPLEWAKNHMDEICVDEFGNFAHDGWLSSAFAYSFSSPVARKALEDAFTAAIDYLEQSPYANRIIGYRLNSGHSIEWLGWEARRGLTLDYSKHGKSGYAAFVRTHYPQLGDVSIPRYSERQAPDDETVLWPVQDHLKVAAYQHYISEAVVDTMIPILTKFRKRFAGKKLIGTYYGYTAWLNVNGRSQYRAHFALKKLLDAQAVDFLMSPQAYGIRRLGDTCGDMKPFASIADAGVISLIENDARLNTVPYPQGFHQTFTVDQTLNVMRRDMSIALCRNFPCLYLAMQDCAQYNFPAMDRDIASEQITGQHCLENQTQRHAEIAIVFSERSSTDMPILSRGSVTRLEQYFKADGSVGTLQRYSISPATETFETNATRYAGIGAPVDYLLAEDLERSIGEYKLYIFANCYSYDAQFLKAVEKLRQRKCTLVWCYAPGYTFNAVSGTANMKQLTGFDLRLASEPLMPAVKLADGRWMGTQTLRIKPVFEAVPHSGVTVHGYYENGSAGLAEKMTGKARSIFCGSYQFDLPFLIKLAKSSGIFCYTDGGDPVEANDRLVTLHARYAGTKRITLPRKTTVIDIFNRKLIGKNIGSFTFEAPLHSTWCFYCGDDGETLLKSLAGNTAVRGK